MSWEITFLYFLSWKFIWFLQKELIKVKNFRLLTAQVKLHKVLIGFFCWKYIKFQLKSTKELYISDNTEEWCKTWRKTNLLFQKWKEFGEFDPSTQNLHFDWSLSCKVYKVWPKIKKNCFVVWKMAWEIWQMFIRTLLKCPNW